MSPSAAPLPSARKFRRRTVYCFDYLKSEPYCQGAIRENCATGIRSILKRNVRSDKEAKMRRRTFLSTSAIAGLSLRGARAATAAAGDIPKRGFGKNGEKLTIIGQAGCRFPLCSYEDAKAVTLRAYELGINYYDCARIYWNGKSEEVYGDVLPPFRKHIFLTTKSPQ